MQAAQFLFHLLQGDEEAKKVLASVQQKERYGVQPAVPGGIMLMRISGGRSGKQSLNLLISRYEFWLQTSCERSRSQTLMCALFGQRKNSTARAFDFLPVSLPIPNGCRTLFCICTTLMIFGPLQMRGRLLFQ
jgi:hypothetical protein